MTVTSNDLDFMVDHLPVAVFMVSSSGEVMLANALCKKLLGYTPEEMKGMKFQTFTHPEDLEKDIHLLSQSLKGEREGYTLRKRYIRKDGSVLHAILNVRAIYSKERPEDTRFISVVQDATEVFKNIDTAGLQSQKIHALTQYLEEMVWICDPTMTQLLFLNARFEHLWDMPLEDAYQSPRRIVSRIHPDDRERILTSVRAKTIDKWDIKFRIITPDGVTKYLRDHGQRIKDALGDTIYLVGSTMDVTKEHDHQQELKRLTRELEEKTPHYCDRFIMIC